MQTLRLRVNDKVYKHLLGFLKKFKKDELQVIEENEEFLSLQEYLEKELENVQKGKAEFIDSQQLDDDLEATIRKHEA